MSGRRLHAAPGLAALLVCATFGDQSRAEPPPEDFEQILPRGRISAIDTPTHVDAKHARIPNDAWVLGVAVEGQA